jgi:nitrite reductase/ring-hydroxylating ferredoxin subunit
MDQPGDTDRLPAPTPTGARRVPLRVLTPDGRDPEDQPKWRRDFPIDVDQDNYVARRDFTKFIVLISGSFVAGQGWIALKALGGREAPGERAIARLGEIPVGGAALFWYPEPHDTCVLIRTGEREFVAYSNKCSHLSCAVTPDVRAGLLRCPCHHGVFELATGRPLAGPPRRPLPRVICELRGDTVYATGVEARTT